MNRNWGLAAAISSFLAIGLPVHAADMPLKAVRAVLPPPSWTGFYVGAQIGGGWADRTVTYAGNDPLSSLLVNGALGIGGEQPVAAHNFKLSGITGGIEAGYNWQTSNWIFGLEADFTGSSMKGSGSGTSTLATAAPTFYSQTVSGEQKIDWWGTVRARLGMLAGNDLLLYATGGLAYGKVTTSDNYVFNGAPPAAIIGDLGGFSFFCTVNVTCLSGSTSSVKTGWTAGAGGEWRWTQNWTFKAEYLYVNLGNASVNAVARAVNTPGTTPASYRANFSDTDFHVVRLGVNYHF